MRHSTWPHRATDDEPPAERIATDGGTPDEPDGGGDEEGDADDESNVGRSNVEVTESGEAEPADPKWEKPDLDELPEFEIGGGDPGGGTEHAETGRASGHGHEHSTEGMPNEGRIPGDTRIEEEGTEGYVVALELCARLPDDVRLPEEAAELVPAAVEAELEQDVGAFAASEFDNASPHVDTLDFVERDGEVWLKLRLGVAPATFGDLDPDEIRAHALQKLEGMF